MQTKKRSFPVLLEHYRSICGVGGSIVILSMSLTHFLLQPRGLIQTILAVSLDFPLPLSIPLRVPSPYPHPAVFYGDQQAVVEEGG